MTKAIVTTPRVDRCLKRKAAFMNMRSPLAHVPTAVLWTNYRNGNYTGKNRSYSQEAYGFGARRNCLALYPTRIIKTNTQLGFEYSNHCAGPQLSAIHFVAVLFQEWSTLHTIGSACYLPDRNVFYIIGMPEHMGIVFLSIYFTRIPITRTQYSYHYYLGLCTCLPLLLPAFRSNWSARIIYLSKSVPARVSIRPSPATFSTLFMTSHWPSSFSELLSRRTARELAVDERESSTGRPAEVAVDEQPEAAEEIFGSAKD